MAYSESAETTNTKLVYCYTIYQNYSNYTKIKPAY